MANSYLFHAFSQIEGIGISARAKGVDEDDAAEELNKHAREFTLQSYYGGSDIDYIDVYCGESIRFSKDDLHIWRRFQDSPKAPFLFYFLKRVTDETPGLLAVALADTAEEAAAKINEKIDSNPEIPTDAEKPEPRFFQNSGIWFYLITPQGFEFSEDDIEESETEYDEDEDEEEEDESEDADNEDEADKYECANCGAGDHPTSECPHPDESGEEDEEQCECGREPHLCTFPETGEHSDA